MIRPRASLVLGLLAAVPVSSVAVTQTYIGARVVTRIDDRCAQKLGQGFVDLGNGVCGRVARSLRIYVGPQAPANAWTGGGTASAAMRSDGTGMLPGATTTQHLRVRGNLDSYSPFR